MLGNLGFIGQPAVFLSIRWLRVRTSSPSLKKTTRSCWRMATSGFFVRTCYIIEKPQRDLGLSVTSADWIAACATFPPARMSELPMTLIAAPQRFAQKVGGNAKSSVGFSPPTLCGRSKPTLHFCAWPRRGAKKARQVGQGPDGRSTIAEATANVCNLVAGNTPQWPINRQLLLVQQFRLFKGSDPS